MPTYQAISTVTVGSAGAASIDFTAIPQNYTDLKLVVSARTNAVATYDNILLKFNGSTSNYSVIRIFTDLNTNITDKFTSQSFIYVGEPNGLTSTVKTFNNLELYIPNYTSSQHKPSYSDIVQENNASSGTVLGFHANLWADTSAITSIKLDLGSTSFVHYTTATLYGIKNS